MKAAYLLALERDVWRVCRVATGHVESRTVAAGAEQGPVAALPAVKAALEELGYANEGLCLGRPADWVLAAEIDCQRLPRRDRHTALLYRLEEQPPLEAERLTAQFLPAVAGRRLGLALQTARVQAFLEDLARAGVRVAAICPTALLALWQVCRDTPADASATLTTAPADYMVLAEPAGVELFRLRQGVPVAWHSLGDAGRDLAQSLAADSLNLPASAESPTLRVAGEPPWSLPANLADELSLNVLPPSAVRPLEAAAQAAADLNAKAVRAIEQGRLDEAEKHLKAALNADVDCGPAHNNLGLVYFRRRQPLPRLRPRRPPRRPRPPTPIRPCPQGHPSPVVHLGPPKTRPHRPAGESQHSAGDRTVGRWAVKSCGRNPRELQSQLHDIRHGVVRREDGLRYGRDRPGLVVPSSISTLSSRGFSASRARPWAWLVEPPVLPGE